MTNPFQFTVATLLRGPEATGMPQLRTQTGPCPQRIGAAMIALPAGKDLTVEATLTPLGGAIMVDATVSGELEGECVRCLAPLHSGIDLDISQVYATDPDFITGDPEEGEDVGSGDETPLIEGDMLDITQAVIDEAGLVLPFNPVCEQGCSVDMPPGVSMGVSGEEIPARWAGLEKFL